MGQTHAFLYGGAVPPVAGDASTQPKDEIASRPAIGAIRKPSLHAEPDTRSERARAIDEHLDTPLTTEERRDAAAPYRDWYRFWHKDIPALNEEIEHLLAESGVQFPVISSGMDYTRSIIREDLAKSMVDRPGGHNPASMKEMGNTTWLGIGGATTVMQGFGALAALGGVYIPPAAGRPLTEKPNRVTTAAYKRHVRWAQRLFGGEPMHTLALIQNATENHWTVVVVRFTRLLVDNTRAISQLFYMDSLEEATGEMSPADVKHVLRDLKLDDNGGDTNLDVCLRALGVSFPDGWQKGCSGRYGQRILQRALQLGDRVQDDDANSCGFLAVLHLLFSLFEFTQPAAGRYDPEDLNARLRIPESNIADSWIWCRRLFAVFLLKYGRNMPGNPPLIVDGTPVGSRERIEIE